MEEEGMADLSVVGNLLVEAGEVELVLYVVLVHLNHPLSLRVC